MSDWEIVEEMLRARPNCAIPPSADYVIAALARLRAREQELDKAYCRELAAMQKAEARVQELEAAIRQELESNSPRWSRLLAALEPEEDA